MLDVGRPIQHAEPAREGQVAGNKVGYPFRKSASIFTWPEVSKERDGNGITLGPRSDNGSPHLGREGLHEQ